jgi:hypothetical protein
MRGETVHRLCPGGAVLRAPGVRLEPTILLLLTATSQEVTR